MYIYLLYFRQEIYFDLLILNIRGGNHCRSMIKNIYLNFKIFIMISVAITYIFQIGQENHFYYNFIHISLILLVIIELCYWVYLKLHKK